MQSNPKSSPKSISPKPLLMLGSSSPRRIDILRYFALPFEQASPPFDESSLPFEGDPIDYVKRLSEGKATSLTTDLPLLTADTIVYYKGEVYGKPISIDHAREMLQQLSGKWHSVFTALTLTHQNHTQTEFEETRVKFRSPTPEQLEHALNKLPWQDKAGGYLIQGAGSLMVERIDGCYYNVVGMPIGALAQILKTLKIDLWKRFP